MFTCSQIYVYPLFRHAHTHIHTHANTHTLWLWLWFSFCMPTSGPLSYSWAICLGKCCVRCVSNRTSSVPPVHLLIVSSSACWSCYWCPCNTPQLAKGLQLDSLVHHVLNNLFNLMCASLFKIMASGLSMVQGQAQICLCVHVCPFAMHACVLY